MVRYHHGEKEEAKHEMLGLYCHGEEEEEVVEEEEEDFLPREIQNHILHPSIYKNGYTNNILHQKIISRGTTLKETTSSM